jgi:hypothetical protein
MAQTGAIVVSFKLYGSCFWGFVERKAGSGVWRGAEEWRVDM